MEGAGRGCAAARNRQAGAGRCRMRRAHMSGLRVSVGWNGRRVDHVHVVSARPAAQPLLVGRTPDQAIAWIPRLFSLCGKAQQAAARLALAGARGESAEADPATLRGVLAEQAQEHLWRVLRDWPRCLGLPPRDADFAGWFRRLAAADEQAGADLLAYVEKEILGRPVDPWMALGCRDEIAAWAKFGSGGNAHGGRLAAALLDADGGTGEARCLPLRPDFAAFEAVDWSGEFPQRPTWEGAPAETGAYGRWRAQPMVAASGDGLLARLVAAGATSDSGGGPRRRGQRRPGPDRHGARHAAAPCRDGRRAGAWLCGGGADRMEFSSPGWIRSGGGAIVGDGRRRTASADRLLADGLRSLRRMDPGRATYMKRRFA